MTASPVDAYGNNAALLASWSASCQWKDLMNVLTYGMRYTPNSINCLSLSSLTPNSVNAEP